MKKIGLLLGLAALVLACGRFKNEDTKTENQTRIAVISKQYNELIFALGAEKDVVAVDISSVYPPEIKKLPTVGYHRALSLEGLIAANPTLIMHNGRKSLGPEHVVRQMEELKIPEKIFNNQGKDLVSTKALMREMGTYFGKEKQAEILCSKLDADMEMALEKAKIYTDTPSVLMIHFGRASNVYLVMSRKGAASQMIEWAGGKSAVSDTSGMRHLSAEVVTKYNPDVILLTDFGYDRLGTTEKIKELPGIALTNAAKNNRIYRVNECDMVYFGPRTGEITQKLQSLIHENTAQTNE